MRVWEETASGLAVPPGTTEKRPIGIDLFCGAGGMSLGFIQAGFDVIAGVDNDPLCAITYLTNLGRYPMDGVWYAHPEDELRINEAMEREWSYQEKQAKAQGKPVAYHLAGSAGGIEGTVRHFFFGDIRAFDGEDMLRAMGLEPGEVDCVFGGPPCQGYSISGRRNVMDPRNSLVFEFGRVVLEMMPKTICMENVPGIMTMVTPEGIPVVDAFCLMLEQGDFGSFESLKKVLISTGAGAAIRKKDLKRPKQPKPRKRPAARQLSLLRRTGEGRRIPSRREGVEHT